MTELTLAQQHGVLLLVATFSPFVLGFLLWLFVKVLDLIDYIKQS